VSYPLKREYSMRDFERSARFAGVPLKMPEKFPIATQNAARIFWWLHDTVSAERAVAWARHGLRALFARGVDLSDIGELRELCAEFDLEPSAAEAAWNDPHRKARLKAVNDAAIAAGVFGAPYFVIDGEPFWGNDRRPQIERWLEKGPF
jgi:2-hydroxychromene-2-carboxylate isomerase